MVVGESNRGESRFYLVFGTFCNPIFFQRSVNHFCNGGLLAMFVFQASSISFLDNSDLDASE